MWRAVRLVVDTGMHHLKWDRQRAIDFFLENAPKTEHDIVNEIDRYISHARPGARLQDRRAEDQGTARPRAPELGERFDVREFHDVVLLSGAVPLDVLETQRRCVDRDEKGRSVAITEDCGRKALRARISLAFRPVNRIGRDHEGKADRADGFHFRLLRPIIIATPELAIGLGVPARMPPMPLTMPSPAQIKKLVEPLLGTKGVGVVVGVAMPDQSQLFSDNVAGELTAVDGSKLTLDGDNDSRHRLGLQDFRRHAVRVGEPFVVGHARQLHARLGQRRSDRTTRTSRSNRSRPTPRASRRTTTIRTIHRARSDRTPSSRCSTTSPTNPFPIELATEGYADSNLGFALLGAAVAVAAGSDGEDWESLLGSEITISARHRLHDGRRRLPLSPAAVLSGRPPGGRGGDSAPRLQSGGRPGAQRQRVHDLVADTTWVSPARPV